MEIVNYIWTNHGQLDDTWTPKEVLEVSTVLPVPKENSAGMPTCKMSCLEDDLETH